ncbi:MAG: hypothetical protein LBQ44_11110 [Treponema sp.]|jgi:hypothetical protein|nr:hypothetical protein [Treponema sp.]
MPDTEDFYESLDREAAGKTDKEPAVNPYESPRAEVSPVKSPAGEGALTETMRLHLKKTAPWLRFIGIMGFVFCGLMTVFSAAMAVGFSSFFPEYLPASFDSAFTVTLFLLQAGSLPLGFFPSFFIFMAGKKMHNYIHSDNAADLESSFKFNKFFWLFAGILTIIYMALIALVLIAAIIGVAAVNL